MMVSSTLSLKRSQAGLMKKLQRVLQRNQRRRELQERYEDLQTLRDDDYHNRDTP